MPYDLVTDEHMRERLTAGQAQVVATTPAETVQYNGARWTRTGDMWVLDHAAPARLTLTRADPYITEAAGLTTAESGTADAEYTAAEDTTAEDAAAEDAAAEDTTAEDAAAAPEPGRRRRPRRRALIGAACLAAVATVAVAYAVSQDRARRTVSLPIVTASPSVLPGTGSDAADQSEPTGPLLGDPPLPVEPPTDARSAANNVRPGLDSSPSTGPQLAPPLGAPAVQPAPPPPGQPAPPAPPPAEPAQDTQPATPQAAAADLEAKVNLVRQAGHLTASGQTKLLHRVHRIENAVVHGQSRKGRDHVGKEIGRMLREMDDLREHGELTVQAEHVLESAIDRLKRTL
jgi:hypothetical protein